VRLLPPGVLGKKTPVRLLAYSLGCRVAYRMAVALCQIGKEVQLVLLDGPAGPERYAPSRFSGMVVTMVERIRVCVQERELVAAADRRSAPLVDPSVDSLSGQQGSDPLDALVQMVASMGADAASVAMALLQLPDEEESLASVASGCLTALHVAAEASNNRTNGTIEAVERCLPGVKKVTVAGGHFDMCKRSAQAIAEHANGFYAGTTPLTDPVDDDWL
jgi:thioesterase domain-containing protein